MIQDGNFGLVVLKLDARHVPSVEVVVYIVSKSNLVGNPKSNEICLASISIHLNPQRAVFRCLQNLAG